MLVIDSKSHRHALSLNWTLSGFLSVSVVSLHCMVFWTTDISVRNSNISDLMYKPNRAASALANAAQHGLVASSPSFSQKLFLLCDNATRKQLFPFGKCPYPSEGRQAKTQNNKEMLFDTLASTR